jgi:hypothetical protein
MIFAAAGREGSLPPPAVYIIASFKKNASFSIGWKKRRKMYLLVFKYTFMMSAFSFPQNRM